MRLGLHGFTRGFSLYRQTAAGLVAARRLGGAVAVGIRVNYQALKVAGYGSASGPSADLAVSLQLSAKTHFGIQLTDPAGTQAKNGLALAPASSAGLGYEPSANLLIAAELIKERSQPAAGKLGVQYHVHADVHLRLTAFIGRPSFSFGAVFLRGNWWLEVYHSYHLRLGSALGIVFGYGKRGSGKKEGV